MQKKNFILVSHLIKLIEKSGVDASEIFVDIDRQDYIEILRASGFRWRKVAEEITVDNPRRKICVFLQAAAKRRKLIAEGNDKAAFVSNVDMHKHYLEQVQIYRRYFIEKSLPR